MKELSIEEKAKAYDEAIERSKNYYSTTDSASDIKLIGLIFPELKESEDEKMRKFISHELACLRATDEKGSDRYEELTNAIAWLEKQGGQKPADKVEPKFKVGDTIYYNSFGELKSMIVANVVTDSTDNPMYEDKEGNAVFEKDLIEHKSVEVRTTGYWNVQDIEQKPAWSEEDEDILNTIINHFKVDVECTDEDDMVRWLKFLKDRVQPKQEWGEEDKKMLESCCGAIAAADYYTYDDKQEMESWLKSLRPQSTWKPSEEQLDSLRIAIGDEQGSDCCGMLRSLLKDLKSL